MYKKQGIGPGGLFAPPMVADEAKLAIVFTYFFSFFPFFPFFSFFEMAGQSDEGSQKDTEFRESGPCDMKSDWKRRIEDSNFDQ